MDGEAMSVECAPGCRVFRRRRAEQAGSVRLANPASSRREKILIFAVRKNIRRIEEAAMAALVNVLPEGCRGDDQRSRRREIRAAVLRLIGENRIVPASKTRPDAASPKQFGMIFVMDERDLYHGPNLSFRETHSPAPSTVQIRPELRVMAAQEAAKQRAAAENKSEAIAHRSSSDRT